MANSVIPILLAITCTTLVISIFKARKTNKSLIEKTEKTEAELKLALTEVTAKTADLTAKDKEVASLTDRLNSMDGEKTKIQEELKKIKLVPSPDVQTTQEVKDEDLTLNQKISQALVPDNQKS